MQTKCPSCGVHWVYESEHAVAVDEYGECMHCLNDHKTPFSAHYVLEKAKFRIDMFNEMRSPHDWRRRIDKLKAIKK